MMFPLLLTLWSPLALAEDDPEDKTADEAASEDEAEDTRPSGLPIRVPPKGAFDKEPDPPAAEPAPEPLPAEVPAEDDTRPSGQTIRVPPSGTFETDEPAGPSDLNVPGLPAYLLPAVEAERAEAEAAPPAAPEPEPEPEPVESDDDFLDAIEEELEAEIAAEQASEAEALPTVTVEPELAPPPPPDPVTWEAYQARRLRLVSSPRQGAFDRSPEWTVKTGGGKRMTAHQFARLVGDTATLDALDKEESWATRRGYILAGAGGGLLLGSAVSLVNLRNVESRYQTPLPQEGEFSDYGEYLEAYESAVSSNEAQQAAAQEDRVWTAVALGTLGAITLTVAPRSKDAAAERQRSAANYYSRSEADHWMNVYNAAVRTELGLPAFEGVPVRDSGRLEEEDYEDDLDTELEALEQEEAELRGESEPTDAAEPGDDAAPETPGDEAEPAPTPAPSSPGKRVPELELRIAPGWFGLTGRF